MEILLVINLAHAQSVCTRPFSRGEGPGDEAKITCTMYSCLLTFLSFSVNCSSSCASLYSS